MIGDVSGIICDGAGSACSMKVSTSTLGGGQVVADGHQQPACAPERGIVSDDVDQTIANLGRLSKQGMLDADVEIINIMRAKQQGKAGMMRGHWPPRFSGRDWTSPERGAATMRRQFPGRRQVPVHPALGPACLFWGIS